MTYLSSVFIWLRDTQSLGKEMESSSLKKYNSPPLGILVWFMYKNCGPGNCKITMTIVANNPVRQDCLFKEYDGKQQFPDQQTEWNTSFNWYSEVSKRLDNSKTASLKDSLQKANEQWKTKRYLKQKTVRLMWPLLPLSVYFTGVLTVY